MPVAAWTTLASSCTLHACTGAGARIYSQTCDRTSCLYLVAAGSVRLEVWSENVAGPYAVGAGRSGASQPLGEDGLPLDGSGLQGGGLEEDEEEEAISSLSHEFLLDVEGNNLGTFLSPKHGFLTRAEAQAAEAAAQAALAAKLEKAAREAHAARRAMTAATKDKERSEKLKQGADVAFRAQAAALVATVMANGAAAAAATPTPAGQGIIRPTARGGQQQQPPQQQPQHVLVTHASSNAAAGLTSLNSSSSAVESPRSRDVSRALSTGAAPNSHYRNPSLSFHLPPPTSLSTPEPPAAASVLGSPASTSAASSSTALAALPHPPHLHGMLARPRIKSRHTSHDFDASGTLSSISRGLPLTSASPPLPGHYPRGSIGGGNNHHNASHTNLMNRASSRSLDFAASGPLSSPNSNLGSPRTDSPMTGEGDGGVELPNGPGTIRVCVKAPGQLFGIDGLLAPPPMQLQHLSSALAHAPGTMIVCIPLSVVHAQLLVHSRVRAHLGDTLLAALSAAPWLKTLHPLQRVLLSSLFQHAQVPTGTTLFHAGDCTLDSSPIFFLLEGQVEVALTDERGRPLRKKVEALRFVGELATVVGLCRTGTVTTTRPCVVRVIQRRWLTLFYRTAPHLQLAQMASKALLAQYQVRDEQLLEQMDVQSAFGLFCLKEYSAENIESAHTHTHKNTLTHKQRAHAARGLSYRRRFFRCFFP